jgi:hypothetical protein
VPVWGVPPAADRSATSAASKVTLPVTAPRVVVLTMADAEASVVAVEATVAALLEVLVDTAVPARPLATLAVASAT